MYKSFSRKQQHERPDSKMASQKKLTQNKQQQQQKNGSKDSIKLPVGNQIGQQAQQNSLAEIKTVILPDTQKRNSALKSNLKFKSNSNVKSSTQLNKNRNKRLFLC
ncbi:hypothetical protein ABPG72_008171 [Tetrahymena utriculariae]